MKQRKPIDAQQARELLAERYFEQGPGQRRWASALPLTNSTQLLGLLLLGMTG